MCGIAGVLNIGDRCPVEQETMFRMLSALRHRGPDGVGIFRDQAVGFGSTRLSIIDLAGGWQPISNEDGTLWIVCNGEIFNYVELRIELEARGHRFATSSDVEVVLHLFEELGPHCLGRLNGQFALAVWDSSKRALFLARDRLGIRPLHYTTWDGRFLFGSEIKALLAYPGICAEIDPLSVAQVFTFWSTLAPRTAFRNIFEVPPAHYALITEGKLHVERYWSLDFTEEPAGRPAEAYLSELTRLLVDATRLRLRADVPVGAYLSGGLDSSVICALALHECGKQLQTFSIAFDDADFDESKFQMTMAASLGTQHQVVRCSPADIGRVFPELIGHVEMPILRTAPAPMYLLSALVHEHGLKVVLTGEGADEFLAGYDIFKEMKIRRFWAREPRSKVRPLLLQRLYRDIPALHQANPAFLTGFYERDLGETDSPYYSHLVRWGNTGRARRFLREDSLNGLKSANDYGVVLPLPAGFGAWTPLGQSQYLESVVFLPQYLLSSQGDRVAMGHSVEGRFPFLDYRVVEWCAHLPSTLKLKGLTDKWLLRQLGQSMLPTMIWQRPKRPYRAPIHRSFFGDQAPTYVQELLMPEALQESGIFNALSVKLLVRKASMGQPLSEVDEMALVGIISTQLLYRQFVQNFEAPPSSPWGVIKDVDHTILHDDINRLGKAEQP